MKKITVIPSGSGELIKHEIVSTPTGGAKYSDGSLPMTHKVVFYYADCVREYAPEGPKVQDKDWSVVAVTQPAINNIYAAE